MLELLQSDYEILQMVVTEQFMSRYPSAVLKGEVLVASPGQLSALGTLKSNDMAMAVVKMKELEPVKTSSGEWIIALDDINDPGNLGTILRIADWYGITKIVASEQTADVYNPKVITSSKGSFCRVQVTYQSLKDFLSDSNAVAYGAMLHGEDVHSESFGKEGILVMGNEANGISPEIIAEIDRKITIPCYGKAESLNVAMATAIICDNIRRSQK